MHYCTKILVSILFAVINIKVAKPAENKIYEPILEYSEDVRFWNVKKFACEDSLYEYQNPLSPYSTVYYLIRTKESQIIQLDGDERLGIIEKLHFANKKLYALGAGVQMEPTMYKEWIGGALLNKPSTVILNSNTAMSMRDVADIIQNASVESATQHDKLAEYDMILPPIKALLQSDIEFPKLKIHRVENFRILNPAKSLTTIYTPNYKTRNNRIYMLKFTDLEISYDEKQVGTDTFEDELPVDKIKYNVNLNFGIQVYSTTSKPPTLHTFGEPEYLKHIGMTVISPNYLNTKATKNIENIVICGIIRRLENLHLNPLSDDSINTSSHGRNSLLTTIKEGWNNRVSKPISSLWNSKPTASTSVKGGIHSING